MCHVVSYKNKILDEEEKKTFFCFSCRDERLLQKTFSLIQVKKNKMKTKKTIKGNASF